MYVHMINHAWDIEDALDKSGPLVALLADGNDNGLPLIPRLGLCALRRRHIRSELS